MATAVGALLLIFGSALVVLVGGSDELAGGAWGEPGPRIFELAALIISPRDAATSPWPPRLVHDEQPHPRGVVYIGDGAWGVGTRPVHDPAETWYLQHAESTGHAIILTLDGTHRHILVVSEDGEVIDEMPRTPRR